jgi:hypothetical protein
LPLGFEGILARQEPGDIPMSAVAHGAWDYTATPNSMLRTFLRFVKASIEAHAEYRAKSALSPSQLQQLDREIRRYRRLMQAGNEGDSAQERTDNPARDDRRHLRRDTSGLRRLPQS